MLVVMGVLVGYTVFAVSKDDIIYPVAELANCQNEDQCRAYCDDPSNINECLAFAERHQLLSAQELEKAKRFLRIGAVGPGDCSSESECEAYCENVAHIQECLAFAEQHGFMDAEELAEAKKVAQALQQGARLPGGCTTKSACEAYCHDPRNMRECLAFAEQGGFIPPEKLREAKQVLKAVEAGVQLPGGCRGEKECRAYCENSQHMEECVEFGIAAGFIPKEEAEQVRKILPLMKEGKMPAGCREGREACEAYCAKEANRAECTAFFVEAGFMTAQEAELFAKTGGKGPDGCTGEKECEAFCNNPANQSACFEFAKEHGLIPAEELHTLEQGVSRFKEGFQQAPPEVARCLRDTIGEEVLHKIEAGTFLPNPELGDHMRRCFEEHMPGPGEFPPGEFPHEGPPPDGFFPPGGFQHPEGSLPSQAQDCVSRLTSGLTGPPTPDLEQRIRQECFPQPTGEFHSGVEQEEIPQEFQGESHEDFQKEFEARQQEEFQRQFEQQFQEEFQRQLQQGTPEGFHAPEGFQVPEGFQAPEALEGFTAPDGFQVPEGFTPPAEFHEFQGGSLPPASGVKKHSFFGAVWEAMKPALRRWAPSL